MKPIIIIGAGGHASICLEIAKLQGKIISGYIAKSPSLEPVFSTFKWIGTDDKITPELCEQFNFINAIGSLNPKSNRSHVFKHVKSLGGIFVNLIHPSAIISHLATYDEGVQIFPGAIINAFASIGQNVILNTRSIVEHNCTIKDHVHLAPAAVVLGNVQIHSNCHIGANSVILQNLIVSESTTIGAGAIVTKNFRSNSTLLGVPAHEK